MSGSLTLQDVQGLIAVTEAHATERHNELISRFDWLERRVRANELEDAGNRPIIKGALRVTAMLCMALIAGYTGSLFSGS